MSLLTFWPTEQNILDCIKPEAENPLDSVFLAIHQSMKLKRRRFGSDDAEDGTEQDLLDDFLRRDLPTGTLLMPILGSSGIGKSHVVRWLDVQLRQRSDSDSRHVIRIPKSSSLKSVLRRILEGLEGSRYDDIRRQLQSARERMTDIQATERIRAELITAIRQRTALAKDRKARARETGGAIDPNDELWIGHGDQRYLPALLSDPITSCIFMEEHEGRRGTIAELARHLTEDSGVENAPRRQFTECDFDIPDDLKSKIKEAAVPAKKYLERLNQSNGQAKAQATQLLNEIIDDAIAPLATPADTSLSDLFYSVRQQLLEEGRELVLLVEDFAVLTGIQGALLDAMIREGVRGKQEACVMRTALAVTQGYFKSYETVRTRAVYAWYIDEVPNESEDVTVGRISDFAGAYLNAARFGAEQLTQLCKHNASDRSWLPEFVDNETLTETESQRLDAFGYSPSGHALFPFNRSAILQIADWRMRDTDGRLRFNPRSIINDLLIPVLRGYRQQFERDEFPPKWFLAFDESTLGPDVRSQIVERFRNAQEQKRLFALVRFWGGNPGELADLRLPKPVYEAFNLPTLDSASRPLPTPANTTHKKATPRADDKKEKIEATPAIPSVQTEPKEIAAWMDRLEKWSQGQELKQKDANELRKAIVDAVMATIDWDAELLRELLANETRYLNEWVYLPNAKGASQCEPTNAFVVVATPQQFSDSDKQLRLILALRAVVRFHHYKTWDYDRADEDFTRYANFIACLRSQAIPWLTSFYRKVDGDPVPALIESLLFGARILNIESAQSREDALLIDAIFANANQPVQGESTWDTLRKDCFERRDLLIEEALSRTAARQGSGSQVFAVDGARLLEAMRALKTDWQIKSPFPKHRSGEEGIGRIDAHIKDLMRRSQSAITERRNLILSQWQAIHVQLGDDFDKQAIVAALNHVVDMTRQFSIKDSQDNLAQLSKLIEGFRDAAVAKCLQHAQRIKGETGGGALLSALAQVDDATLTLIANFVSDFAAFLDRTQARVQSELSVLGESIVEKAVGSVDTRLQHLQESVPSGV